MSTSRTSTKPESTQAERISEPDLAYMRTRNKHRLYSMVMAEFKRSGLRQADLAKKLHKKPEVICRLLANPGNWQIDTVSDLLYAISNAELRYNLYYPLEAAKLNSSFPLWIDETPTGRTRTNNPAETGSSAHYQPIEGRGVRTPTEA